MHRNPRSSKTLPGVLKKWRTEVPLPSSSFHYKQDCIFFSWFFFPLIWTYFSIWPVLRFQNSPVCPLRLCVKISVLPTPGGRLCVFLYTDKSTHSDNTGFCQLGKYWWDSRGTRGTRIPSFYFLREAHGQTPPKMNGNSIFLCIISNDWVPPSTWKPWAPTWAQLTKSITIKRLIISNEGHTASLWLTQAFSVVRVFWKAMR